VIDGESLKLQLRGNMIDRFYYTIYSVSYKHESHIGHQVQLPKAASPGPHPRLLISHSVQRDMRNEQGQRWGQGYRVYKDPASS
jgi:hypothetical protein